MINMEGYHEHSWECSVHWGIIISTVGYDDKREDYHE